MNIALFGKVLIAIGALSILLGIVPVVTSLEKTLSYEELSKARARMTIIGKPKRVTQQEYGYYLQNVSYNRKQKTKCIVSKIGNRFCPMGGYTAIFTYLGLLISMVGGGLIFALRKPQA